MALGGDSPSTTEPSATFSPSPSPSSSASSSASSSSQSSSSDGNSEGFTSKGANYFFGFLVTFIVLLSIFICCGFSTRRRLRRRALFEWGEWDSNSNSNSGSIPPTQTPTLFEPNFTKMTNDNSWILIQPLAAQQAKVSTDSIVNLPSLPLTLVPPPPPTRRPSRNPQAIHGLSLPTWSPPRVIVPNSDNKEKGTNNLLGTKANKTTLMQVAVIIAMPHPTNSTNIRREEQGRHEEVLDPGEDHYNKNLSGHLEIGVASQIWNYASSTSMIPEGT
ncbi:hypothetical protein D9757_005873 [Collybiopsis confluens]|uniref:Uncharacterized protein n=1 Tax=Collybiopsis confluens TaxID=2823264 RepID=A0A8H5MAI3_9AGAR|nr:hypothetical protein D9757_005873 [Collybiopsis confluens]